MRIPRAVCSRQEWCNQFKSQLLRQLTCGTLLVTAITLFGSLSMAQSTSELNGSVSDPSGANVVGATITLTSSATGLERSTTSSASGLYQFLDVPPGTYRLQATAKGFAPFLASDVTLVVKTPSTINIKLQLAGVAETVDATGNSF